VDDELSCSSAWAVEAADGTTLRTESACDEREVGAESRCRRISPDGCAAGKAAWTKARESLRPGMVTGSREGMCESGGERLSRAGEWVMGDRGMARRDRLERRDMLIQYELVRI
jgi:hypothetical protein